MNIREKAKKDAANRKPRVPVMRSARTFEERHAAGKALRQACPRSAHATWKSPQSRPDAVQLVQAAEKGRLADLLPLRHGRMARSAFTFYRGWRRTLHRLRPSESAFNVAATRTCATSVDSPPRSGGSSSPSTTSTSP